MVNKQTMQLKGRDDIEIVGIQPTFTSYIDDKFYTQKFREKEEKTKIENIKALTLENVDNYKTFAVKVQCVRADWIVNDDINGIGFLRAMVHLKNKDIFMTNYTKIFPNASYFTLERSKVSLHRSILDYTIHEQCTPEERLMLYLTRESLIIVPTIVGLTSNSGEILPWGTSVNGFSVLFF